METRTYHVKGMDCANCARKLEKGINQLTGVEQATVDFASGKLHLAGDVTSEDVQRRTEALGYTLFEAKQARTRAYESAGLWDYILDRPDTRLLLTGTLVMLVAVAGIVLGVPAALGNGLLIGAMAVAAWPIARSGVNNLVINRDFNIEMLMTIAAIGAVIIGEYLEAALVIILFAVGLALEGYSAERARGSIRSLMALAPATAIRLRDGQESEVPVEALEIDDLILVKPGERIPMDGIVQSGESDVNQAPITGESMPVPKASGEDVFAGTINGSGALVVRVTHLVQDNTLSRIIALVEEAQSVRAPSQRIIDRFARWYTPLVVMLAAAVAMLPPLLWGAPFLNPVDGSHGWLYRALTLLVIACPCALVISAPVTIISAITAAARQGVLFKGGVHLEMLGTVNAIVFDKTGTLTRGEPVVIRAISDNCATDSSETCPACDDVLALAAAVERRSTHPLANAVVAAAETRNLANTYVAAENIQNMPGMGLEGYIDNRKIILGSHRLFDERYPHSQNLHKRALAAESVGQSTMLLRVDDEVRGLITFSDALRPESQQTIAAMKALNKTTVMLTGDHRIVAEAVGNEIGVDTVKAELMPVDKVASVQDLRRAHHRIAMVGDGINDAPALAAADVGIAMGGAGSAQTLETADVVLMADDLQQLPAMFRLSRQARQIISQNVVLSVGTKLVFVVLAILGIASLWLAMVADVGVMLLVVLNGMRPLRSGIQRQPQM
ncbi:MAG: cation-translocating P-type ATPase [Chloroflexi bacterium]|nr:cation-translocating P-type ATPase [Chloroflexota bacterium]